MRTKPISDFQAFVWNVCAVIVFIAVAYAVALGTEDWGVFRGIVSFGAGLIAMDLFTQHVKKSLGLGEND